MDLQEYLKDRALLIDKTLFTLLPSKDVQPAIIHEAMHYSIFAGGKRLRPIMCLASAEAVGKDYHNLLPAASALEMIHTYSLIHDDLPAMDNDDYRRGKLTNHRVFGEAVAILAGDALLTLAFEVIANYGIESGMTKECAAVIKEVTQASGTIGMVGGQVVDMESEGKPIDSELLKYIHTHKTGALFKASVHVGAIFSHATEEELELLTGYAEHFGLAFQITDDILDVSGDSLKLGKKTGSDTKNGKNTYPAIYGLDKSRQLAEEAVENAVSCLKKLKGQTKPLEMMVRFLLARES